MACSCPWEVQVQIERGGLERLVAEVLLDLAQVHPRFEQMRGVAVAQRVEGGSRSRCGYAGCGWRRSGGGPPRGSARREGCGSGGDEAEAECSSPEGWRDRHTSE
jgi:hypothetical protein